MSDRLGELTLALSLENVAALRPVAELVIRATGGWGASPEDEADRALQFEQFRTAIADLQKRLDRVDEELRRGGIEHPLGDRGVRDLVNLWNARDEDDG